MAKTVIYQVMAKTYSSKNHEEFFYQTAKLLSKSCLFGKATLQMSSLNDVIVSTPELEVANYINNTFISVMESYNIKEVSLKTIRT